MNGFPKSSDQPEGTMVVSSPLIRPAISGGKRGPT